MERTSPDLFMVFDVESVGLYGEGFAVGYVVIDRRGEERESGFFRCQAEKAMGRATDMDWVRANVIPSLEAGLGRTYSDGNGSWSLRGLRERFWNRWAGWRSEGAIMAADCPWPVEARFLRDCIADLPAEREQQGPYPLIDVASVRLAAGLDPLGTEERLDRERPAHNPLADARQSARLLIEALDAIGGN